MANSRYVCRPLREGFQDPGAQAEIEFWKDGQKVNKKNLYIDSNGMNSRSFNTFADSQKPWGTIKVICPKSLGSNADLATAKIIKLEADLAAAKASICPADQTQKLQVQTEKDKGKDDDKDNDKDKDKDKDNDNDNDKGKDKDKDKDKDDDDDKEKDKDKGKEKKEEKKSNKTVKSIKK